MTHGTKYEKRFSEEERAQIKAKVMKSWMTNPKVHFHDKSMGKVGERVVELLRTVIKKFMMETGCTDPAELEVTIPAARYTELLHFFQTDRLVAVPQSKYVGLLFNGVKINSKLPSFGDREFGDREFGDRVFINRTSNGFYAAYEWTTGKLISMGMTLLP